MILELVALLCTGLFAGAAIYVSLVEHPARLEVDRPWPSPSSARATGGGP